MAKLTQAQIDELLAKLVTDKYTVAAGATALGPLAGVPKIEPDIATNDVKMYETGAEVHASVITKNEIKITIETHDVDTAMTLLAGYKVGDNVFASAKKVALAMVPITDAVGAKTITFPNAYLQPGLSMTPAEDETPSKIALTYICREVKDGTDVGKVWTYA